MMPGRDRTRPLETVLNGPKTNTLRCGRCGAEFHCGMNEAAGPCWCTAYPKLVPVPQKDAGCYCPACLGELTAGGFTGPGRGP